MGRTEGSVSRMYSTSLFIACAMLESSLDVVSNLKQLWVVQFHIFFSYGLSQTRVAICDL